MTVQELIDRLQEVETELKEVKEQRDRLLHKVKFERDNNLVDYAPIEKEIGRDPTWINASLPPNNR